MHSRPHSCRSGTARAQVVVVDPDLRGRSGHYLQLPELLAPVFGESGYEMLVVGAHSFQGPLERGSGVLGCRVVAALTPNDGGRGWLHRLRYACTMARELAAALSRLPPTTKRLLLFQTSDLAQVLGYSVLRLALWRVPRNETHVHVLRWLPGTFRQGSGGLYQRIHTLFYRLCYRFLRRGRLQLASDSGAVVGFLREVGFRSALLLPIPTVVRANQRPEGKPITVGYVGGVRLDKGGPMLPAILEALVREAPGARFLCQLDVYCDQPGIEDAVAAIRSLAACHPQITTLNHALTKDGYNDLLSELDIVLLPYCPQSYANRTSGPCIEAMAAGKVIVGPQSGWLARAGKHYRGYVPADTTSAASVETALLQAIADFDALDALARADSVDVAAEHNPRAFVRRMASQCWR